MIARRHFLTGREITRRLQQVLENRSLGAPVRDWVLTEDRGLVLLFAVLDTTRVGRVERYTAPATLHHISTLCDGVPCCISNTDGLRYAFVLSRLPALPDEVVLSSDLVPAGTYTAALGVGADGPVALDLAGDERAVLVGGTSGSGKSRTTLSLVLQVARKCDPDRLSLALVDLKELDFAALSGLPHLVEPVAVTEEDADGLVARCVVEMERRQAVMAARQVTRWNLLPESERFPLLLVVIDEIADLAESDAMGDLVALARKGRASGISLILATQRPDARVLSRQVKANLPTRVAFRVTDATESRIILDRSGAERIKRRGLALTNAGGVWRKVQCAYVPDGQVGDWCRVAPVAINLLSGREVELVRWALARNDGYLARADAEAQGWAHREARRLLESWERRGWLRQDPGRGNCRRVTGELAALAAPAPNLPNPPSLPRRESGEVSTIVDIPKAPETMTQGVSRDGAWMDREER